MELLVIIAMVSILVLVSVVLINPVRQFQKGRDTQRRNTLKQLQGLIEQYYNDHGSYPDTGGVWYSSEPDDLTYGNNSGDWIPGLVPDYTASLPRDPVGGTSTISGSCSSKTRAYLYRSDGKEYALLAFCSIEAATLNNPNDSLYDSTRPDSAWKVCLGDSACSW